MSQNNLRTLLTCNNAIEASIIKDTLRLGGISSFIHDENVLGLDPSAGVELKIFAEDIYKAQQILSKEQEV